MTTARRTAPRPGEVGVTAPTPGWLVDLAARTDVAEHEWFATYAPPEGEGRRSAVLMLFGPDPRGGEDVVLTERAHTLRSHPGQVSFPGGRLDPDDDGSVAAALREAEEEVGPRPRGGRGAGHASPTSSSRRASTPSPRCSPGGRARCRWGSSTAGEVERVLRVPVADLVAPANRFTAVFGPYQRPGVRGGRPVRVGIHRDAAQQPVRPGRAGRAVGHHRGAPAARPRHVAVDAGDARVSGSTALDLTLLCLLGLYAWSGWRQGFVSALLGLVGPGRRRLARAAARPLAARGPRRHLPGDAGGGARPGRRRRRRRPARPGPDAAAGPAGARRRDRPGGAGGRLRARPVRGARHRDARRVGRGGRGEHQRPARRRATSSRTRRSCRPSTGSCRPPPTASCRTSPRPSTTASSRGCSRAWGPSRSHRSTHPTAP